MARLRCMLGCLLIGLASTSAALTRDTRAAEEGSEISSTTTEAATEAATDVDIEPIVEKEGNGEIVVTAEESSENIKEENVGKCNKCLKSSFRYRHDGFCGKCVHQDVIDVHEQEELDGAVKCRKCNKSKFRARNALMCSKVCAVKVEPPIVTNIITPSEKVKDNKEMSQKSHKKRKKSQKKEEREKRRKEKQQRKLAKKNKKFGYNTDFVGATNQNKVTTAAEAQASLGPWGELLKAIIIQNTWK